MNTKRPAWLQEYRAREGRKWGVLVERRSGISRSVNWLNDHDGSPVEFDSPFEAEAKAHELSTRLIRRHKGKYSFRAAPIK
jgi:hypothetical protein